MRIGRNRRSPGAASALIAAVFAVLVQALAPAAALAAESLGARQVELCTPEGARTVSLGADGEVREGFAGLPCHDCLGATLAFLTEPELSIAKVVYAAGHVRHEPQIATVRPRARAPPRPPGQGPPTFNA